MHKLFFSVYVVDEQQSRHLYAIYFLKRK